MSSTLFHAAAAVLLTGCVFCIGLGSYYGYVMNLELRSRLPDSRWTWLRAWAPPVYLHCKYCPESQTRKKCFGCTVGMLVCGFLGFFFWMK